MGNKKGMKKGFTLLELMISLGLSAIILIACTTIVLSCTKYYYKMQTTAESTQINSKVLLTYINFFESNKVGTVNTVGIGSTQFTTLQSTASCAINGHSITFSSAAKTLTMNGVLIETGIDSVTVRAYKEKLTPYTVLYITSTTKGITLTTIYNLDYDRGVVTVEP